MAPLKQHTISMGSKVQLTGAVDRETYIRQTLERLRQEKIKQAQDEVAMMMANAQQEVENLLAEGREKAAQIIAEGEAQRDEIKEAARSEGHQDGYNGGYQEGRDAADEDSRTLIISANVLLERGYEAQQQIINGFAPKASRIMETICEKILHKALTEMSSDDWQQWFQQVLADLHTNSQFRIVVGADSFREFQSFSAKLSETMGSINRIRFEVDPHLAPFEMYVITDEGTVDISPNSQLHAYLNGVTDTLDIPTVDTELINPPEETDNLQQLQTVMFQTVMGSEPSNTEESQQPMEPLEPTELELPPPPDDVGSIDPSSQLTDLSVDDLPDIDNLDELDGLELGELDD